MDGSMNQECRKKKKSDGRCAGEGEGHARMQGGSTEVKKQAKPQAGETEKSER